MINHPQRSRRFAARLDTGARARFATITAARRWAEDYGTTANWCLILQMGRDHDGNPVGTVVGEHRRDPNGDGTRWFRAHRNPDSAIW